VYEDLLDFKALKVHMENQLEDYNLTPGVVPMSLVLFRDAIEHGESVVGVIGEALLMPGTHLTTVRPIMNVI